MTALRISSTKTKTKNLLIGATFTDFDSYRIKKCIDHYRFSGLRSSFTNDSINYLDKKLQQSTVVESKNVPGDIVTIHSTVQVVDLNSSQESVYTIVFPEESDIDQNKISVLSPIGCAIIGHKVNDIAEIKLPRGITQYQIKNICYQPEAAGDYHL